MAMGLENKPTPFCQHTSDTGCHFTARCVALSDGVGAYDDRLAVTLPCAQLPSPSTTGWQPAGSASLLWASSCISSRHSSHSLVSFASTA